MTAILGFGSAFPSQRRENSDRIFEPLVSASPPGSDLFRGYEYRHVLAPDERIEDFAALAAERALASTGVSPLEVDALLGRVSLGQNMLPEGLIHVHSALNLREDAWVWPINDEFTNFLSALVLADAWLKGGDRHALVVVASDWTRNVDYATPQALSAGDGAAACVLGPVGEWQLRGSLTHVRSDLCDVMTLPRDNGRTAFHISESGRRAFVEFGANTAPKVALELLARHGVHPRDVALVSHQASAVLLESWRRLIQPAEHHDTLRLFGNVTVANIAATLDHSLHQVESKWLLLLGVGPMQHCTALLLKRSG